jgi:hypothetical protein
MEIEYTLTVEDCQAGARQLRRLNLQRRQRRRAQPLSWLWSLLAGFVLVAAGLLFGAEVVGILRVLGPFLAGFLAALLVLILLGFWSFRTQMRRKLQDERNRWVLGPRCFRLDAEGILSRGECFHHWLAWPVIWNATATDEHMFFFFSTDMAHIVPRRAFADLRQWREFVSLARRYWRGDEGPAGEPPTGITTIPDALPADDFRGDPSRT